MLSAIKPIETKYGGYRFRSRLEARWAVFFDKIGLDWVYEPEGFVVPGYGWYLPDFHLNDIGLWVEIKPIRYPKRAWRTYEDLPCSQFENMVLLMGPPAVKDYGLMEPKYGSYEFSGLCCDIGLFVHCKECKLPAFGFICNREFSGYSSCKCINDAGAIYENTASAVSVALGERF